MFVNVPITAQACLSGNSLDENQNIVIKDPSGVIKTPGYPSSYPVNLVKQCYWKILTPKGKVVRVDFSSFRLAIGACVELVHTLNKRFSIETTHCGQKPSFVVYSMTNELGIRIREHYSNPGPGFTANYTTVIAGKNERFACRYFTQRFFSLLLLCRYRTAPKSILVFEPCIIEPCVKAFFEKVSIGTGVKSESADFHVRIKGGFGLALK